MRYTVLLIFILFFRNQAHATSVNGSQTARIINSLSVSNVTNINFGVFYFSSSGSGTLSVNGSNVCTPSGSVARISSSTCSAGSFSVSGEPSISYTFNLPASTIITNGANNITVNLSFASGSSARTLSVSGTDSVTVGANLNITSGQAAGSYSGTYNVTVNY